MKLIKAQKSQIETIWHILQKAIERRKEDGSNQWQDGYPNIQTIQQDIDAHSGYVLMENETILAYLSIVKDKEPAYADIVGKWLTNQSFLVIHRLAVSPEYLGKGIAKRVFKEVENIALSQGVFSIKVDTNFDNKPMLHIFKKLNYSYCGKVYFRGSERLAFERVLLPE
ncbi:MAG: GNAT family N-acetyltransferase [Flavobacteriales bacterium]|jgi:GNAT superfamily N-acetyltransferase|nr:GNAT family N-acetyltransferase [Flavobacteriales bacterium]